MKLSKHAIDQLNERYTSWGLDIDETISFIHLMEHCEEKYRMVLIDDIPVVLTCDYDEVITIYPHPVDAAESYFELLSSVKNLRKALNSANGRVNTKQKYINKLEKKLKHREKQVKEMWK